MAQRQADDEARKIEEAKKTIHQSGKALGRNANSGIQSSYTGSGTVTSDYTEMEEDKKEEDEAKPAHKQVDR